MAAATEPDNGRRKLRPKTSRFSECFKVITEHLDFRVVTPMILGGPATVGIIQGFTDDVSVLCAVFWGTAVWVVLFTLYFGWLWHEHGPDQPDRAQVFRVATNPCIIAGGVGFLALSGIFVVLDPCVPRTTELIVNIAESDVNPAGDALDEYVCVTNVGRKPTNLLNWTLTDTAGHRYDFPSFILQPNESVRVHTGPGTNSDSDLYWGFGRAVWRNDGDTATLSNAQGSVEHEVSYPARAKGVTQGPCNGL
jgi:hypothetical protein